MGQKRLGRAQLTRPKKTHILSYNPCYTPGPGWPLKEAPPICRSKVRGSSQLSALKEAEGRLLLLNQG